MVELMNHAALVERHITRFGNHRHFIFVGNAASEDETAPEAANWIGGPWGVSRS